MPKTEVRSGQIKDATVGRDDLDAVTSGKAVVRKIIAGTGITLSSTGPDAGTGDVTINSTASGGGGVSTTEIDFGSIPVAEASFNVTDASVSATSDIAGSVAYVAPTGKDLDELEMDQLDLKFAPGNGQFTIYAKGLEGYVYGKFKINYVVG